MKSHTYIELLNFLKKISTNEYNIKLKVIIISTDFKNELINAIKLVFQNIGHVDTLYVYFIMLKI